VGRFRHVTVALVTPEGRVTGKLAGEPAVTVAVVEVNVGAVDDPDAESTSNCHELEVPPPGAKVCTVIASVPALAISADRTDAISWLELT